MKKTVFAILFLFSAICANSQIRCDVHIVGGPGAINWLLPGFSNDATNPFRYTIIKCDCSCRREVRFTGKFNYTGKPLPNGSVILNLGSLAPAEDWYFPIIYFGFGNSTNASIIIHPNGDMVLEQYNTGVNGNDISDGDFVRASFDYLAK